MTINSIGIIDMPFNYTNPLPIQPLVAERVKGYMKLSPKFLEAGIRLDAVFTYYTAV
jgi:tRNA (Thr-GGU) A37 N-methylase